MAKEQKGTNLYLMSIVAIVAIVGIVILVLNVSGSGMMFSSSDSAGQAISANSIIIWRDCGNGEMVSGGAVCSTTSSTSGSCGGKTCTPKQTCVCNGNNCACK